MLTGAAKDWWVPVVLYQGKPNGIKLILNEGTSAFLWLHAALKVRRRPLVLYPARALKDVRFFGAVEDLQYSIQPRAQGPRTFSVWGQAFFDTRPWDHLLHVLQTGRAIATLALVVLGCHLN